MGIKKYFSAPLASGLGGAVRRAATALLLMLLTTATAWADTGNEADGVYYIAADGKLKNTATDGIDDNDTPILLTSNTLTDMDGNLAEGWYVVNNNITYDNTLTITGDVNIILADGRSLTVDGNVYDDAISLQGGNLTIYGQPAGTGTLTANGAAIGTTNGISGNVSDYDVTIIGGTVNATGNNGGIICKDLTIIGGTINATGTVGIGIEISETVTISGGNVTANGIAAYETVTISGGIVNASGDGIFGYEGIALSYSSRSGYISASSFDVDEGGAITIADGMTFIDGDGNRYDHTTTTAVLEALTDVTLTPDLWGVGSGADGTEAKPYVISNALELDMLAYRTNNAMGDNHAASGYEGKYFVLGDDIAYDASGLGAEESNYTAIGNYLHSFKGIFDGQHHTVSGIRIYKNPTVFISANQCQGLFGNVDNVTVRNVAVADARITGYMFIGGIVGLAALETSVENCLVVRSSMTCYSTGGAIIGSKYKDASLGHNYYSDCSVIIVNQDGTIATTANSNIGYNTGDIIDNDGAVSCILHTLTLADGITATAIMANQGGTLSVVEGATVTLAADRTGYSFDSYTVKDADDNNVDLTETEGVYTFTMPASNVTVTATWKKLLTNDDIDVSDILQQTYTGSAICPEVSVTDGETTLTQDTDYSVEYSDNVNVGTAKATITGIGNYAGSVEKTFEIVYPIVTTSYVEADGTEVNDVQAIQLLPTMTTLPGGTYVVDGDITYSNRLNFTGDATLILCDGATMSVGTSTARVNSSGIVSTNALTIYGQSLGTGTLSVYTTGIGCSGISAYALLTINGGYVTADSDEEAATALYGADGVTINGGTVNATASSGIGINSAYGVTIYGGTVSATGGNNGISGSNVTINGGTVTANGDNGIHGNDCNVTINGGNVTANGTTYGIYTTDTSSGEYEWDINISGGTVTATGGTCGIYSNRNITLGWTNFTDRITASSYGAFGNITIADGQEFTDADGYSYSGTLFDGTLYYAVDPDDPSYDHDAALEALSALNEAIGGKSLYPYNAATITLAANKAPDGNYWTTFYCGYKGYSIDGDENACAYTATVSGDVLTLYKLGKVIPKQTAVIIVGSDNSIGMTASDETVSPMPANSLRGVDVRTEKSTLGTGTFYVMGKKNDDFGFFEYSGTYMPASKAYLLLPASQSARSLTMVFADDNGSAGVSPATVADEDVRAPGWFTLDGRRLAQKPAKSGVYVANGRKIVIK